MMLVSTKGSKSRGTRLTRLVNVTVIRFGDDVSTVTGMVVSQAGSLGPLTVGFDDGDDVGCDDGENAMDV